MFSYVSAFAKNTYTLENQHIRAEINKQGQVESLKLAGDSHDVFKPPKALGMNRDSLEGSAKWSTKGQGNQVVLFDDIPLYWDAWDVMDYHLETGKVLNNGVSIYCSYLHTIFFIFFIFIYRKTPDCTVI